MSRSVCLGVKFFRISFIISIILLRGLQQQLKTPTRSRHDSGWVAEQHATRRPAQGGRGSVRTDSILVLRGVMLSDTAHVYADVKCDMQACMSVGRDVGWTCRLFVSQWDS